MNRVYRSTDAGAPNVLTNAAGTLIQVLDAVLIDGYSLGNVVSVTRSGNTVTVTMDTPHGMLDHNKVLMAGMDQPEYNGEHTVIISAAEEGGSTFTYAITGTPASPATGTITARKAGSGWSKPFSGANKAAYLQPEGSNLMYLRVDDTIGAYARVRGYDSMSDIDTGTGLFPTDAQVAGGCYHPKSNTASVREWIAIATDVYFILWSNYNGSATSAPTIFFGDPLSFFAGDAYHTCLIAGTSPSYTSFNGIAGVAPTATSSTLGAYCARNRSQTGTSEQLTKNIDIFASQGASYCGGAGEPFPAPRGGMLTSPIYVNQHSDKVRRGEIPGVLAPLHNRPLTHFDTGMIGGHTYIALDSYNAGQLLLKISDT